MSRILRIVVSVLLLGVLAWRTDWDHVGRAFVHLRLDLWLAAVAVLIGTQVVSARRWQLMARPLGFERSFLQLIGFYFIGMYFNLLLPTSVGGDVVRAWYLDGGSRRRVKSFASVFLDRLSGVLVLVAMACVGVVLSPLALPTWIPWFVAGVGCCAVGGLIALPFANKIRWRPQMASRLERFQTALKTLREPKLVAHTTLLSVVVQAANVIIVWLVGLAIGADVPVSYYWIVVPMVSLLCMAPVSMNGMGLREWGMALFLAPVGVSEGTALTLAFLWFAVSAAASLLGGLVYLFGRFPRPVPADLTQEGQSDHGPLDRDSDQGRTRQSQAAA